MLIVLLDCSSSMDGPLERDRPPAGVDVRKIDRARQVLNEHQARAHPQERVIVLGFAGNAVELARGHSIRDLDLQSRINAAQLGSGTDIPAALAAAASTIRSEPADGPCTVIVITDGLLDGRPDEDLDSAVAELSPLVAYLKVSLIGASERGLKIAIRISPNAPIDLHPAMKSPAHDGWPASASFKLRSAPEEPEDIAVFAASRSVPDEPEDMAGMDACMPLPPAAVAELAELAASADLTEEPEGMAEGAASKSIRLAALVEEPEDMAEVEARRSVPEEPEDMAWMDACMDLPVAGEFEDKAVIEDRDLPVAGELEDKAVIEDRLAAPIWSRPNAPPPVKEVWPAAAAPRMGMKRGGTPRSVVVARRIETLETLETRERELERACETVRRREPSLGPARDVEDVAVTVAHAPGVARGVWHPLDVFVHLASLEDEVARSVRAERGHGAARASRGARLRRGATVRIEPRIEGAELDVEALEMRWRDDVQRAVFRIRPAAGAAELRGSVDVYVKHAILCTVPIAIAVVDAPRPAEPAVTATGRMMDVVFVSYATEERRIVERVTRTYHELGITVLMDQAFLHAGDMTGEVLRRQIERADVFQLFWSTRSSQKPWVEREWRHALTLTGPAGRKGARFIRPLVWERRPPAWPPELAALQFSRLELAWLARAGARPGVFAAMCLAAAMGFAAVVAIVFALAAVR